MKIISLACLSFSILCPFCTTSLQAQTIDRALPSFEKIVVSPLINVVLTEGENEAIRLEYTGIQADKINYEVKRNTLRIYLDDARITVKNRKQYKDGITYNQPVYKNVQVTAYVTYRQLSSLEVRGEERITCTSPLVQKNFKLKLFGESKVTLTSLETNRLKAIMYGQNKLAIKAGNTQKQRYRVYGENQIETKNLLSKDISTSLFGESTISLNASDQLRVFVLGESDIYNAGDALLSKRLVIGKANFQNAK